MSLLTRIRAHARRRDLVIVGTSLFVIAASFAWTLAPQAVDVYVTNGLDVAVNAKVAGQAVDVGPGSRVTLSLLPGTYPATIDTMTAGAPRTIETTSLFVPAHAGAVVLNVLGASPIVGHPVIYTSRSGTQPESEPTWYAGLRSFWEADVDYPFVEPPSSLSVDSNSGDVHKRALLDLSGGWRTAVGVVGQKRAMSEAAALGRAIADAEPESRIALSLATDLTNLEWDSGSAMPWLAQLLRSHPDADEVAFLLAFEACRFNRCEDAKAILDEPGNRRATSLERRILMASLSGRDEGAREAAAALKDHPDDPGTMRSAAKFALLGGRYQECADLFTRAAGGAHADEWVESRVICLVELGHYEDALAVLDAQKESDFDWQTALVFAQVAAARPALGRQPIERMNVVAGRTKMPASEALARVNLVIASPTQADADQQDDVPLQQAAQVARAALSLPGDAWNAAVASSNGALGALPSALGVLLGAEFIRAGSPHLGRRLLAAQSRLRVAPRALEQYVLTGAVDPRLWRLDLDERAALDFVRARQLDALGQPSAALYAAARKGDIFGEWVVKISQAWPKPSKAKAADFVVIDP